MPKVEFKRVQTDAEVENIDIKDGQLIYTGTGKTYMDYGSQRIPTGSGGSSVDVDTEMSDSSTNAVQNKVIKEYVDDQIEIGDTEPTEEGVKLWIDTGEVGQAVSEITNEYSTSTGLGYSANYINNLHTYSTDEIRIGTWIDGKPLYRKVFVITSLTYNAVTNYSHGIANVSFIKPTEVYMVNTNAGQVRSINYFGGWSSNLIQTNANAISYYISDSNFNEILAIVEYTKSTD